MAVSQAAVGEVLTADCCPNIVLRNVANTIGLAEPDRGGGNASIPTKPVNIIAHIDGSAHRGRACDRALSGTLSSF